MICAGNNRSGKHVETETQKEGYSYTRTELLPKESIPITGGG